MAANSSFEREKALSTVLSFLEMQKCFSITEAPRETAAMSARDPSE